MHLTRSEEFYQKDAPSKKFQNFLAKWRTKVSNFHILKKLQGGLGQHKNKIPKDFGGNQQLSMVGDALIQEQLSRADYSISRPRKTQGADLS